MGARFTPRNGHHFLLNESDCSETQIMEQILNIDKLMKKCTCLNKKRLRNSATSRSGGHKNHHNHNRNNNNNDTARKRKATNSSGNRDERRPMIDDDDEDKREIHVQVMSKSYSYLQGKTTTSSVTVLKVCSKSALKKTDSGNSKFSETESSTGREATSSERSLIDEKKHLLKDIADIENRSDRLALRKGQWRVCITKPSEDRIAGDKEETEEVEERSAGDALFDCPFELVEIYSSRKEKDADGETDAKRFEEVSSRSKASSRGVAKEYNESSNSECVQSNNADEPDVSVQKGILKNNFPRSGQELRVDESAESVASSKEKNDRAEDFGRSKRVAGEKNGSKMDGRETREKLEELRTMRKFDENETNESPDRKSEIESLRSDRFEEAKSNDSRVSENVHVLKRSKRMHDVVSMAKEEQYFGTIQEQIVDEEAEEALATIEEADAKQRYDVESLRLDLYEPEDDERDRANDEQHDNDTGSTIESRVSKLSLKSGISSVSKASKSELSSIENTIDLTKTRGSAFVRQNTSRNSSKENNNMKVIIEKRQNKKHHNVKQCNETGARSSTTVGDTRRERGSRFHDPRRVVTKSEIDHFKRESSAQDSKRLSINWDDINICKMLTKIHERLTNDWQRLERLRNKLQNGTSGDSDKSIMTLQLLDKTIARCKSYIHGASDSGQAEMKIGKLLSKYIIELVKTVNENKVTLENLERRVEQMHLDMPHGQHAARKRTILNEIVLTSDYWASNISCSIEVISRLVKNVIAENEEEENVKNPRKYKVAQRHMSNNIPVNDSKHKSGSARLKFPKSCLIKKESTIETEMSIAANAAKQARSKVQLKQSPRISENSQPSGTERKTAESGRHADRGRSLRRTVTSANSNHYKQLIPRQKHRVTSNSLPAWRPGGTAKIPSSNSATAMSQKLRTGMHSREKAYSEQVRGQGNMQGISMDDIDARKNLMNIEELSEENLRPVPRVHDTMEEKPGRKAGDIKRQASSESCSSKRMPSLKPDVYNVAVKRSDESVKTSPRLKSKTKALKLSPKSRTESLHHALGQQHSHAKSYENASLRDVTDQEIAKASTTFREFEDIIRGGSTENDGDKDHANSMLCYQISGDRSVPLKKLDEAALKKEKLQITEEEPTRDVDSKRYKNSPLLDVEKFGERKLIERLPEQPAIFGDAENVSENSQPKKHSSFISITSTNCATNLDSSSDYLTKTEITGYHETLSISPSLTLYKKQEETEEEDEKENDSKVHSVDFTESGEIYEDAIASSKTENDVQELKNERSQTNCHAASLSMLKDFLCHQGIDVDLVNRAEKYLKDKQKAQKCTKKKSISFADMPAKGRSSEQLSSKSRDALSSSAKSLGKICGTSDEDRGVKGVSRSVQKSRDSSTCTVISSSSVCSQTGARFMKSKSLQTISESHPSSAKQSMGTQTEVAQTKHVASECDRRGPRKERTSVSSMTEPREVSDNFTETPTVSVASKSMSTEPESCPTKQLREVFRKQPVDVCTRGNQSETRSPCLESKCIQTASPITVQSTSKKIEEYKNTSKEYAQMFKKLLTQVYEGCTESVVGYGKMDTDSELRFHDSNMSFSYNSTSSRSSRSLMYCNCNRFLASDEVYRPPKGIPSEIAAALRVAAIRAQNVYRAIDLYKQKLKKRLWKLNRRSRCRRKCSNECRVFKAGSRNFLKSGSVVKIFMRRKGHKNKDNVIEVCKLVRQKDASISSKSYSDMSYESEEEIFEPVGASLARTTSVNRLDKTALELRVPRKASSTVVLRDVKSLMKLLLNDIENVTERTEPAGTVPRRTDVPSKFNRGDKVEANMIERRYSFFCRENLLPVVYGIVCSIVFWCLRFTIYCEVVS